MQPFHCRSAHLSLWGRAERGARGSRGRPMPARPGGSGTLHFMIEDHWLPRPPLSLDPARLATFEAAYAQVLAAAGGPVDPPAPTWAFLCWLADEKRVLLHGTADPGITRFEPRTPREYSDDAFSKQTAVFAAGDGIWALFYAIVHRQPEMRFLNGALQFVDPAGELSDMHYFFSVTKSLLPARPWRDGSVYILPRDGFTQQEAYELAGRKVLEPQWAAPDAVKPLARLRVTPQDFPLLASVRGHDPLEVDRRAASDPDGFPWLY